MSELLYILESKDGVRCTWQFWPCSHDAAAHNVVPPSLIYNPKKEIEGMALVEYDPVLCGKCKTVLNPYCPVDYTSKHWACPICLTRNSFPIAYKAHITESALPTELMSDYTTMEYILPSNSTVPPAFVFLVDTCCSQEELVALKSSLQKSINLLPAESLVCFIAFGKNVFLYNLAWTECSRCCAFRGDKTYDSKAVKDQLVLGNDNKSIQAGVKKYLIPAGDCEFALNAVIEELNKDPWPVSPGNRPLRCTGNALSIAVTLLELAYTKHGGRIMLFTSGACTFGPGMIVGEQLLDSIRTFFDIKTDVAKYTKTATAFYDGLAQKASLNGHCIDIFCCAIDQIGLYEMRNLSSKTGGYLVLTDTYKSDVFSLSLSKVFIRDDTGALQMGFNSILSLHTSVDIKISGALGPGSSIYRFLHMQVKTKSAMAWRIHGDFRVSTRRQRSFSYLR